MASRPTGAVANRGALRWGNDDDDNDDPSAPLFDPAHAMPCTPPPPSYMKVCCSCHPKPYVTHAQHARGRAHAQIPILDGQS